MAGLKKSRYYACSEGCCRLTAPHNGKARRQERRTIKRRDRQALRESLREIG